MFVLCVDLHGKYSVCYWQRYHLDYDLISFTLFCTKPCSIQENTAQKRNKLKSSILTVEVQTVFCLKLVLGGQLNYVLDIA